jgi:hypothetical protein
MSMSKGTEAYSQLLNQLKNSGIVKVNSENELQAQYGLLDICQSQQFQPIKSSSFLQEWEVQERKSLSGIQSNLIFEVEAFNSAQETSKQTNFFDFDFPPEITSPSKDIYAFVLDAKKPLVSSSSHFFSDFTLMASLSLPKTSWGCLFSVEDYLSVSISKDHRVVVNLLSSKKDNEEATTLTSDPIEAVGIFTLVLEVSGQDKDISLYIASTKSHFDLEPIHVSSNVIGEVHIGTKGKTGDKEVPRTVVIGGSCGKDKDSSVYLSRLAGFNRKLTKEELRSSISDSLSASHLISSIENAECEDESASFEDREDLLEDPSPLAVLHWRWREIQHITQCTSKSEDHSIAAAVDTLSLEEMQDQLLREMKHLISDRNYKPQFSSSKESIKASSTSTFLTEHFTNKNQVAVKSLFDTSVSCICDDVTWQSLNVDADRNPDTCLSHWLGEPPSTSCKDSTQCADGYRCASYICVLVKEGARCKSDADIGNGMKCEKGRIKKVNDGDECGTCGLNQVCIESSCRNAFGNNPLARALKEMILASTVARKKLAVELKTREDEVEGELELTLRKLHSTKKALVEERKELEEKMYGAAAVRRGKLVAEADRLQSLIDSFEAKTAGVIKKEADERDKILREDEQLLASLDYESGLRESMEKQLEKLQVCLYMLHFFLSLFIFINL